MILRRGSRGAGDAYAIRRKQMIDRQLIPRGITDPRVLEAMGSIPRHRFVEEALQAKAYSDNALPIGSRQTISQPYIVASMTQLLQLRETDRVLEIGTGSGYQTALLSALAAEVYTVERIRALSNRAKATLREIEPTRGENVHFRVSDGTIGWPEQAPFERIVVTAGAPSIPSALVDQLAAGGRLVIPVGAERLQVLHVVIKEDAGVRTERHEECVFVKLIGREGWQQEGDEAP